MATKNARERGNREQRFTLWTASKPLGSQFWTYVESMCGIIEREGDFMGGKLDSYSSSITKIKKKLS